jgi:hypothetical protein
LPRKLTWRNNGTWAVICFGLALIGNGLVTWLFAASRARTGAIDIEAMASSTTLALKFVVAGVVITAIGAIARLILKPRMQPTQ